MGKNRCYFFLAFLIIFKINLKSCVASSQHIYNNFLDLHLLGTFTFISHL